MTGNCRLAHDVSFACATAILDSVAHLLRPEEHAEAHEVWYAAVLAALQAYDAAKHDEMRRLSPSDN